MLNKDNIFSRFFVVFSAFTAVMWSCVLSGFARRRPMD